MPVPTRPGSRAEPGYPARRGGRPSVGSDVTSFARVRLNLILLGVGIVGAAVVAWTMRDKAGGAQVARGLGMERVAGAWDGILSILAVPALLFFLILAVWSLSELYRGYRAANDPEHYRRTRRSRSHR